MSLKTWRHSEGGSESSDSGEEELTMAMESKKEVAGIVGHVKSFWKGILDQVRHEILTYQAFD